MHAKELLLISNSNFTSFHNSIHTSGAQLDVQQITITGEPSPPISDLDFRTDGAGFHISETMAVSFTMANTFKGLTGRYGGVIYFDSSPNSVITQRLMSNGKLTNAISFNELIITDCNAEFDGGAFYLVDPLMTTISNSVISGCKAGTRVDKVNLTGEGGAIFYGCNLIENRKSGKLQCSLTLDQIEFKSNSALVGGAIRWNYIEPNMNVTGNLPLVKIEG